MHRILRSQLDLQIIFVKQRALYIAHFLTPVFLSTLYEVQYTNASYGLWMIILLIG